MKIHNSLTRKKDEFVPLKPGTVKMYVCGPTVYDEPHIGHARSAYIFDVIRRYFAYKGYAVTFVRNVTDVDDKIIDKARKEFSGEELVAAVLKVSEKYLAMYHDDMAGLGILPPDREPRATAYIGKMQAFIGELIARGAAYSSEGDVYFDVRKAKGYGKLSNQSLEKMVSGARISPGEKKHDPLDFALWKSAKEGEPSWESPWGKGRPGWHIECSAMSSDILGDEFDIHGGGIDLIFPHHENEVAQSEGAGKTFARYWIHNGLLTIDSEKMAKSLGNFITIKDFLAKNGGDGDYLKLFFLSAHYHSPIDYTLEKIAAAKKEKERFTILHDKVVRSGLRARLDTGSIGSRDNEPDDLRAFRARFEEAMDDDFNTPAALATLFDLVTYMNKLVHGKELLSQDESQKVEAAWRLLGELSGVFGLELSRDRSGSADLDVVNWMTDMIDKRQEARRAKNFAEADRIRNELLARGFILEDTKGGGRPTWRKKV